MGSVEDSKNDFGPKFTTVRCPLPPEFLAVHTLGLDMC